MSLDQFMNQFADRSGAGVAIESLPVVPFDFTAQSEPGALDSFVDKFNGVTEGYYFYYVDGKPTVELRFQTDEHIYYLVGALGELTAQDGVTTICHIIDKSMALVPWSAKVCIEKLLRTLPVTERECAGGPGVVAGPIKYVPEMTLEAFTKLALEAKSAHKDVLNEAGDVGHQAHTWLEYYIKAILAGFTQEVESKLLNLPGDERAANCVRAALAWMQAHSVKWIETERKIYSKKYGYAGTMDGLALVSSCDDPTCCADPFKDRLTIIDWKSSNYLYTEYLYQTAAYENAYEEEFGVDVVDRWIIRLGKTDGEFDTWHCTVEDFQEDIEGFLDCLSLTRSVRLTTERMRDQKRARKEVKKAVKEAAKLAEKEQRKEARAELVADRRVKKAEEKELAKAAKKAERAAMKALGVTPAVIEACQSTEEAEMLMATIYACGHVLHDRDKVPQDMDWESKVDCPECADEKLKACLQVNQLHGGFIGHVSLAAVEERVLASVSHLPENDIVNYLKSQLPKES